MIAVLETLFFVALGMVLGSFSSFLSYRIPAGLPWIWNKEGEVSYKRSCCPHCHHPLGFFDLFPVLSWLYLKGRCRYCGQDISFLYPLVEISCAVLAVIVFFVYGWSLNTFFVLCLLPLFSALFVIDIKHMILPNVLIVISVLVGVAYLLLQVFVLNSLRFSDFLVNHIGGAILFSLTAYFIGRLVSFSLNKDALGFGDVKFFGVAGVWLGAWALPAFCTLSGILGVVFALVWRVLKGEPVFPFGPALIAAVYTMLILRPFAGSLFS